MAAPKLVLSKNHTPTLIVEFTFERNGKIEVVEKDILNKEDLLTAIHGANLDPDVYSWWD